MSQLMPSKKLMFLLKSLLIILLLTNCGGGGEKENPFAATLLAQRAPVNELLENLKYQLDSKQLVNALLIEKYANHLIYQKPDYAEIATLLKQDSTSKGRSFTGLERRLKKVNMTPWDKAAASLSTGELELLAKALDTKEFNNSLTDVVNTLASLSDGELAVINVPAEQIEVAQQSNALVGNPSYGHWEERSSGHSFWVWYGVHSISRSVMWNNYSYNSWSSTPHYSYYDNYGRNHWGSSRDVNRNYNLSKRYPSQYNKPSSATKTRYASSSKRASSYGRSVSSSKKSTQKPTISRTRSYGSSSRSSSFSRSRSSRSGK